jgi:hypothetical protein
MSQPSLISVPTVEETPPGPQPAEGFKMKTGEYYDTMGPSGEACVMMTRETWLNYGTLLEKMRETAKKQDERIRELVDESSHFQTSLQNLRDVRRNEKRAEIEGGLVLPGSEHFNKHKR